MGVLVGHVEAAASDDAAERLPAGSDELLELLPLAVCICDRHGSIVRYNRAAANLWGCEPGLGDPAGRHCGAAPNGERSLASVLRTGQPVRGREVAIERPDGARRVALANIRAILDRHGRVSGAIVCLQDVSERRKDRARLVALERRWRALLEALPAAVYTTDAAGRITYYNEAAAELWGRRPKLGDEWCGSWRLRWPDGRPMRHDECPMAVALREGREVRGEEAVVERPDGTGVPFLACPTPIFDENGELAGAVNMLIDLSTLRRADGLAERLAAIVESSDDAIISKDLDGVIVSWNKGAERLYGYAAEEAIGRPVSMLIPEDRPDEMPSILARIRAGEQIEHYETLRRRKDGGVVHVSLSVSPLKDAQGRIVGASKIARDVTERVRLEERQKLLVREINHRIKNLFALTTSLVMLSARSARTPAEMDEALRRRLGALAAAHALTVPEFARGGAASAELGALAQAILAPYAEPAGAARDRRMTLDGPPVDVDGEAVTNVALLLHELATNAAKYGALSTPQGRLEVTWAIRGDDLVVNWSESGGPRLSGPPTREGFGAFVARAAVEGQFGGAIERDWRPDGLVVRLTVPLSRLAA